MFAAILSTDRVPIDPPPGQLSATDGLEAAMAGGGRLALLASRDAQVDEWRGIASLANRFWIAGRLRLDRRGALQDRLGTTRGSSDADLCLLAYAARGEHFLEEIAGDFSFVLWDEGANELICARDQLGVRSLFHATVRGRHFVSDSLGWMASRPEITRALDDYWVADFLAVGHSLDFHRTIFAGVARLPPGHKLKLSGANARAKAYWRLDVPEPLHYRDGRQYAEHFHALMNSAVADRLPASAKVGVSMSGGLDSTTVAAFAVALTGDPARVVAECVHYERLMPDDEARFSSLAADCLGISLRLRAVDDMTYDRDWRRRGLHTPEPTRSIVFAHWTRMIMSEMADAAPVWFYGEGPDNALHFERDVYLSWLLKRGRWRQLIGASLHYLGIKGREAWARGMRRSVAEPADRPTTGGLPQWLDRDLVSKLRLEERAREAGEIIDRSHSWHPRAIGSFTNPIWQALFAERDLEETLAPLLWRHPFLDLRVLEFMLSVPPVPWARNKLLMRQAMQGRLPREILDRPKTPLADSPIEKPIRELGLGDLEADGFIEKYVDIESVPRATAVDDDLSALIAVHALDHWIMYNYRKG
jgi:asparagine synthase (glutamine-hydrolysing)